MHSISNTSALFVSISINKSSQDTLYIGCVYVLDSSYTITSSSFLPVMGGSVMEELVAHRVYKLSLRGAALYMIYTLASKAHKKEANKLVIIHPSWCGP